MGLLCFFCLFVFWGGAGGNLAGVDRDGRRLARSGHVLVRRVWMPRNTCCLNFEGYWFVFVVCFVFVERGEGVPTTRSKLSCVVGWLFQRRPEREKEIRQTERGARQWIGERMENVRERKRTVGGMGVFSPAFSLSLFCSYTFNLRRRGSSKNAAGSRQQETVPGIGPLLFSEPNGRKPGGSQRRMQAG